MILLSIQIPVFSAPVIVFLRLSEAEFSIERLTVKKMEMPQNASLTKNILNTNRKDEILHVNVRRKKKYLY